MRCKSAYLQSRSYITKSAVFLEDDLTSYLPLLIDPWRKREGNELSPIFLKYWKTTPMKGLTLRYSSFPSLVWFLVEDVSQGTASCDFNRDPTGNAIKLNRIYSSTAAPLSSSDPIDPIKPLQETPQDKLSGCSLWTLCVSSSRSAKEILFSLSKDELGCSSPLLLSNWKFALKDRKKTENQYPYYQRHWFIYCTFSPTLHSTPSTIHLHCSRKKISPGEELKKTKKTESSLVWEVKLPVLYTRSNPSVHPPSLSIPSNCTLANNNNQSVMWDFLSSAAFQQSGNCVTFFWCGCCAELCLHRKARQAGVHVSFPLAK